MSRGQGLPLAPEQAELSLCSVSVPTSQARRELFLLQGWCRYPHGLRGWETLGSSGAQPGLAALPVSLSQLAGGEAGGTYGFGGTERKEEQGSETAGTEPSERQKLPHSLDLSYENKRGSHYVTRCPNCSSSSKTPSSGGHHPGIGPETRLLPTVAVVKSVFVTKLQETALNSQFYSVGINRQQTATGHLAEERPSW